MRKSLPILAILAAAALSSCSSAGFYAQAIGGQLEILRKAKSIPRVVADTKTSAQVRNRLLLVQDIREFARADLGLETKGQYDRYTDLGRPYVVWVVFATPEFSTQAHEWWYPIIGKLKYRGFFKQRLAEREARRVEAEGMDVFMQGVEAYSTLGVFHDPVLNTFIARTDAQLAELLFHELTHQRLYLSGDTDFNEAFATAIGQEGARRWLRARGRLKDLRDYDRKCVLQREFIAELLQTRAELKRIYGDLETVDAEAAARKQAAKPKVMREREADRLRQAKAATLVRLRQRIDAMNRRYGGKLNVAAWFKIPVNNARLNSVSTYYDLVPGFEAMIHANGGDLDKVFDQVDAMGDLNKTERRKLLLPDSTASHRR